MVAWPSLVVVTDARPEPTPALSPVAQDYLKVVWSATEWAERPVTTKLLATRLGVGASTVSETVRRLADQGLLTHEPYGAVGLTDEGRRHALAMVRRHRLVETFLVEVLGYGWDEVHDEAEVLEHAVSDVFVERVAERLGHPVRDPHGDPIPGPDGSLVAPDATPMWDADPGRWTVARISDADPDLLRYLDEVGIGIDTVLTVGPRRDAVGTVGVTVGDRVLDLGQVAAHAIWITPAATR
ncbi:metal-dependent transcriptional regulator [Cellulomonas sp. PSBB021]|uniref:metal-dependent transcriptional regulator n=1 Tax=Cellulomonas sp. PSBB021 TaxID=2003551 RepID=UPI000B8D4821|nr:metal-dependent transcriptional regulator [Cellulomonas sp. PSBB021]ASR54900.1 DtxR family transcriptional regulator [Cellulomonas sp. PSBB021]